MLSNREVEKKCTLNVIIIDNFANAPVAYKFSRKPSYCKMEIQVLKLSL